MAELTLNISEKALATITAAAIDSVAGTVRVSRRASRDLPRVDVQLNPESHAASVEVFIGVQWPSPVSEVTQAVVDTVTTWLDSFAGVTAKKVTVVVDEIVRGNRVLSSHATQAPITIEASAPQHAPVQVSAPADADWKRLRKVTTTPTAFSKDAQPVRVTRSATGKVLPVRRRDIGQFAREPEVRKRRSPVPKVGVLGTPDWKYTASPYIVASPYSQRMKPVRVHSRMVAANPRVLRNQWSRPTWEPKARPLEVRKAYARPVQVREVAAPRPKPLEQIYIRPVTAQQLGREQNYA
ncbi:MAG: Asp23/Gls24 family envelope stress response protein [Corynebacterium sp.]|nr:Asp23/Gls24 family envelope stress response protein [Corynebacterium sp.]